MKFPQFKFMNKSIVLSLDDKFCNNGNIHNKKTGTLFDFGTSKRRTP